MRYYRTTGLMLPQMQELVCRVSGALAEPWNKGLGRPRSCGLYGAVEISCMYLRQNRCPFTGVPWDWCQLTAGSGGSQGFPSMAVRMASGAGMPWAAAESR